MANNIMDNNTYNLIMALASNLEAREAYMKYAKDGNQQLWNRLVQDTENAIQMLQGQLSNTLNSSGTTGSYAQGSTGTSTGGQAYGNQGYGSNQSGYTTDMGGGRQR